jgi:hypothetical protein
MLHQRRESFVIRIRTDLSLRYGAPPSSADMDWYHVIWRQEVLAWKPPRANDAHNLGANNRQPIPSLDILDRQKKSQHDTLRIAEDSIGRVVVRLTEGTKKQGTIRRRDDLGRQHN